MNMTALYTVQQLPFIVMAGLSVTPAFNVLVPLILDNSDSCPKCNGNGIHRPVKTNKELMAYLVLRKLTDIQQRALCEALNVDSFQINLNNTLIQIGDTP